MTDRVTPPIFRLNPNPNPNPLIYNPIYTLLDLDSHDNMLRINSYVYSTCLVRRHGNFNTRVEA